MNTHTSFKRLAIGQTFTAKGGQKFRKLSPRLVFKLKESGRGEVHAKLPFAKNTAVIA